ncbi:MAG TPA: glucose-1-phosphate adenylyltransferase [Candidatus Fimousia stercorigallinarum]|nr:glucose-1-phosphate adenylyltransferase [Candidatus Fimousia stercorigallinarum]
MVKKEMIAMLLAGGQGSRLGVLTSQTAKPAVSFGGKYRIIDFPLSNCINSGIDTVGVMTQYMPLKLNQHVGIGIPWDLDRNVGGVTVLPPYEKKGGSSYFAGTADAIYQNLEYMDTYNPDYVLILSGDHIYKMDYELMLENHKQVGAQISIAAMEVPMEEASRFGIVVTDDDNVIVEFQEKPEHPKSNKASMGIYIFDYKVLKNALIQCSHMENLDFGMHVIPYCFENGNKICAYEFQGYWKDVGTLNSYWEANMDLISLIPEFNLYEEYWRVYTKNESIPPMYVGENGKISGSIVGDESEIYGTVENSVIGSDVVIGEGTVVKDSIIMNHTRIGENAVINKAVIAENVEIEDKVELGVFEEADNTMAPHIYNHGLVAVGQNSYIPYKVKVGKNVAIFGKTTPDDYPDRVLPSGESLIK